LNRLQPDPDALQRFTQPDFNLFELLRDQRQPPKQVVEVLVHLGHAACDRRHLSVHAVHRRGRAVDEHVRLLLERGQRGSRVGERLVHDSDLPPHLADFRFDLDAQVGHAHGLRVQHCLQHPFQAGVHRVVQLLRPVVDHRGHFHQYLVGAVLDPPLRVQNVVRRLHQHLLHVRQRLHLVRHQPEAVLHVVVERGGRLGHFRQLGVRHRALPFAVVHPVR